MIQAVLDASALLAVFLREAGGEHVRPLLGRAAMISVNYCEVASRLFDLGAAEASVTAALSMYQLEVVSFDAGLALDAAALRPLTRHLGLSLGDRACLALAKRLQLPAMTADRAWAQLDLGIAIEVIR